MDTVHKSLLPALGLGIGIFLIGRFYVRPRAQIVEAGEEQKHTIENSKTREPGEWVPQNFDYPVIDPCKEELADIKPIPYRPFRWGPYFVTMGIRRMLWNEWIELDQQFEHYYKIREERIRTRGGRVLKTLPEKPGVVGSGSPAGEL